MTTKPISVEANLLAGQVRSTAVTKYRLHTQKALMEYLLLGKIENA